MSFLYACFKETRIARIISALLNFVENLACKFFALRSENVHTIVLSFNRMLFNETLNSKSLRLSFEFMYKKYLTYVAKVINLSIIEVATF